jgi:hypothetical protein
VADDLTAVSAESKLTREGDRPDAVQDLAAYKAEEQPWWTPLPPTKDVRSEELASLAGEIDIVLITATDPELEAVLRQLEPYPRRKAVLIGFAEQETYYLGKFGACLAAVTKCRMGSLDSGGATLATEHAPSEPLGPGTILLDGRPRQRCSRRCISPMRGERHGPGCYESAPAQFVCLFKPRP